MVGITTYLNYLTAKPVADAAQVAVEFKLYGWVYQRLPVLSAEYEVHIVFYE
jgi:hypothetical protein